MISEELRQNDERVAQNMPAQRLKLSPCCRYSSKKFAALLNEGFSEGMRTQNSKRFHCLSLNYDTKFSAAHILRTPYFTNGSRIMCIVCSGISNVQRLHNSIAGLVLIYLFQVRATIVPGY